MMKRWVSFILCCALAALLTGGLAAGTEEYVSNEVFVSYRGGGFEVLRFENRIALALGIARLAHDERVELIQPNYVYENTAVEEKSALFAQQWALANDGSFFLAEKGNRYPVYDRPFESPSAPGQWEAPEETERQRGGYTPQLRGAAAVRTRAVKGIDVNALRAWELYEGKDEVVVALIDSGVDFDHEGLRDCAWVNPGEIPGNGRDDDNNGYVDDIHGWNFYNGSSRLHISISDSHGTHCAGTIAADPGESGISGIAPAGSVRLMSLKALGGADGTGTTASVVAAIEYAEANGASICNMSLGNSRDDKALYQAMASSSMLFVVAAGNEGSNIDRIPCYPASYGLDNIITVANLNYDGKLHFTSGYGSRSVDIAAPGSYILSTTPGDGYSYMTGTSMAAPMVSAAAAMVYSHFEDISLSGVKEILLGSAKRQPGLVGDVAEGGMLDIAAALSFDTAKLKGKEWQQATFGESPVIEVDEEVGRGKPTIKVTITDADGDIAAAAYTRGAVSAALFKGGEAGQRITLDAGGRAELPLGGKGYYTIYAIDDTGNETTLILELTGANG